MLLRTVPCLPCRTVLGVEEPHAPAEPPGQVWSWWTCGHKGGAAVSSGWRRDWQRVVSREWRVWTATDLADLVELPEGRDQELTLEGPACSRGGRTAGVSVSLAGVSPLPLLAAGVSIADRGEGGGSRVAVPRPQPAVAELCAVLVKERRDGVVAVLVERKVHRGAAHRAGLRRAFCATPQPRGD